MKRTPMAPGVFDILPSSQKDPWRSSHIWIYVEDVIRKLAKAYGFQEIRTPLFERTELFQRGVGETSDIVSKEMYTFNDKGNRSLSLRPEGTASVMRALLEGHLHEHSIEKVYYIAPMFRYERAQAGRYRQHHQFGAEAIGIGGAELDAEVIDMLYTLYNRLGLKNLCVNLNSIGDIASRLAFRTALQDYLRSHYDHLSADSKNRFEINPMRILDSKDPADKSIVANAPSILDYLNEESKEHFENLKMWLKRLNIPFEITPLLVRGLDYYNKTVFEITSGLLGAQNSLSGGGRYDGLIKNLGGPDLPAIGFGAGLERIIQTMLKQEVPIPQAPQPAIYLIPLGTDAKITCFDILHKLRQKDIAAEMDLSGRKLGKAMQYANQIKASNVCVIGDEELAKGEVSLKDMTTGSQKTIVLEEIANHLNSDVIS